MEQHKGKLEIARRAALGLAVAAAVGYGVGSVKAQESPADGVTKDRIDWGLLMDMSGPTSASQSIWVAGFQDYMKKVNEGGGIFGRKVNVLAEDNRFNAATDKIAFEKLVGQTPVIAISGMGTSASQVALAPTIKAGKVPIVGTYTSTSALSEPVTPMVYNGFCGYKQMAQAGVGYLAEKTGAKAPKVVTVAIESAGGKEYHDYVAEAVGKLGGTAQLISVKVTAADITPQILELMAAKPDFITIYGVANTSILTMKALGQYGAKIPAFGITYLGAPQIFKAIGPEAGANYNFISCFTPGGADASAGNAEMSAYADKVGRGAMKEDINYVAGWVVGQMAAEALQRTGDNPTRAKLVETLSKGFTVDSKGLAAPFTYTPTNNTGPVVFKMFGYDYATNKFKAFGEYADYAKYTK
ncbi:ABC transporter substrate-binding protein [uncultured Alsobacter sp.]|uniref:ABC transporter substrate-binding protein n=1 Tax=uncultured Alsobacter sp. TaxID=1748258 RepID=UPI0025E29C97|nr:ABC transporter substrate-binding protein [uncultured Alsobacter sp.]